MRRHFFRTLVIGGATAAAVALGAGQAFAAGTITITGANTTFATAGSATLGDSTSGQNFGCVTSLAGSLANVTNAPVPYTTTQVGGAAHSVTSVATCSSGNFSVTPYLPWDFVLTGVTGSPPQATGFVQGGNAAGLLFHVSVLTCAFDVAGQADFTWTGSQLIFTGNGTLHPVHISAGCFGLVSATDLVRLTGSMTFTPSSIMIA